MRKPIRRVVTGHDAAGRSVFITDAAAPHVYNRAPGSAVVTELWETRAMPADNSGNDEVTDHPFRLAPPRNGSVFRIVEYPPDKERVPALASEASGQRGNSIVRAPDTRPEPGSSARLSRLRAANSQPSEDDLRASRCSARRASSCVSLPTIACWIFPAATRAAYCTETETAMSG